MKRKAWFVYMLECRGGRIYTGIAVDVAARFAKHRCGKGAAFTRMHPPRRILGLRRCQGRSEALKAEYALKQLDPAEKRAWARKRAVRSGARGPGPKA